MNKLLVITTTFSKREEAQVVAETLLKKRLVACAQISDKIQSIYWWQDQIEKSNEYVLTLKTKEVLYEQIESLIKKIHPYETPEIIGIKISHIDSEYRRWLFNEVC